MWKNLKAEQLQVNSSDYSVRWRWVFFVPSSYPNSGLLTVFPVLEGPSANGPNPTITTYVHISLQVNLERKSSESPLIKLRPAGQKRLIRKN